MGFSFRKLPDLFVMNQQINYLGPEILEAKYTLWQGTQIGLPKDQWQREVTRWSALQLATFQHLPVRFATGVPDERLFDWIKPPYNAQELFFAQNQVSLSYATLSRLTTPQKICSTAHANFSVLGLCITLSIGTLIIVAEALLHCVYARILWKGRDYLQYERLEWCLNGTMQLQRLAHEQRGFGTWHDCDEVIPVEKEGATLATLDISNPKHPVFQRRLSASRDSRTGGQHISTSPSANEEKADEISSYHSEPTHKTSLVEDKTPLASIEARISSRTPSLSI
jgi:hypothetical protein